MTPKEQIKYDMIQVFGQAYRDFGLNSLMGHVVALLLFTPHELSLDEIADQLGRSKGPISQIMRRLTDHNLIRKIWKPGTRKDYYEIEPNVFANAFNNNFNLIKNNTQIAHRLLGAVEALEEVPPVLHKRLTEMQKFYELMEKHYQNFLDEWKLERAEFYGENHGKTIE